jgi:hypothetical protein
VRRSWWRSGMVAALVPLTACGGSTDARPPIVSYDSSGSRIVVNRQPAQSLRWSVSAAPALRIGAAFGTNLYEFHDIQGATRLADGRIAVLDGGSGQLRMYLANGHAEWAAGRLGDGPGEAREPRSLQRVGGNLLQYQDGLSRIRYRDDGTLISHDQFDYAALRRLGDYDIGEACRGLPNFIGDDVLVCWTHSPERSFEAPWSLSLGVGVMPWNGTRVDTVGMFFIHEGWQARLPRISRDPVPLIAPHGTTGKIRYDPRQSALLHGISSEYSIFVRPVTGGETLTVRRASAVRKRTDVERALTRDWGPNPPMLREAVERYSDRLPANEEVSLALDYYFDELGFLWVKRRPTGEDHGGLDTIAAPNGALYGTVEKPSGSHDVFAADGRYIGTVAVPPSLTVLEIGRDYVLGMDVDRLGVQRVVVHQLSRDTAS